MRSTTASFGARLRRESRRVEARRVGPAAAGARFAATACGRARRRGRRFFRRLPARVQALDRVAVSASAAICFLRFFISVSRTVGQAPLFDQPMREASNKNPRTIPLALWARIQAILRASGLYDTASRRFGPNEGYPLHLWGQMAPQLPASALAALSGYIDWKSQLSHQPHKAPRRPRGRRQPPQLRGTPQRLAMSTEEPAAPPPPPPAPAAPPPATPRRNPQRKSNLWTPPPSSRCPPGRPGYRSSPARRTNGRRATRWLRPEHTKAGRGDARRLSDERMTFSVFDERQHRFTSTVSRAAEAAVRCVGAAPGTTKLRSRRMQQQPRRSSPDQPGATSHADELSDDDARQRARCAASPC